MGTDGDESPVFLALDWRNNEKAPNYCVVTNKTDGADELPCLGDAGDGQNPQKLTLHRCLEQFMRSEILSPEEAWYCPQ